MSNKNVSEEMKIFASEFLCISLLLYRASGMIDVAMNHLNFNFLMRFRSQNTLLIISLATPMCQKFHDGGIVDPSQVDWKTCPVNSNIGLIYIKLSK